LSSPITRKETKPLFLGDLQIGGGAPVVVQSMTCTDTRDVRATLCQIKELEAAGCEAVRVAVPDREAAEALIEIKQNIKIPLIADIHFDYRLALAAIGQGIAGVRVNPGNIGKKNIREIAKLAKERGTVLRIGINAGSLEKEIFARHGGPTAGALVESALRNIAFLEDMDFTAIKLSLKSSDVATMIEAYRTISEKCSYPLHLGVTEAGTLINSAIKSSLGIGILLYMGIGDTIRVSVTGDPVSEIRVAYGMLRALGVRKLGPDIIACPTCGRCEIDVLKLAEEVEERLAGMKTYLKIALMGCVVNGPGEAAEADIGIAGGRGFGFLFKKGEKIKKIKEEELVDVLMEEVEKLTENHKIQNKECRKIEASDS
jgi:(E)-4-hydroxy-3-methylbut-2-enyl-diphosphate synthase